jgi:hypothetical protein
VRSLDEVLWEIPDYPVALVVKGQALRRLSELKRDRQLLAQALDALNHVRAVTKDSYAPGTYNAACYKALLGQPLSNFIDDLHKV